MASLMHPGALDPTLNFPAQAASTPRSGFGKNPLMIVSGGVIVTLFFLLHRLHRLAPEAMKTGDTDAYLNLESFRPPLYGGFLQGWHWLHGSLTGLPTVQFLLLLAALLLFAVEFGLLLRSVIVPVAIIPLVLAQPGIYDAPGWMMTESLYLALIMAGLAMLFRHARRGGLGVLVAAGTLFGLATVTRSTGIIFLALPVLAALFDRRVAWRRGLRDALASLAAAILVMLCAMSWNEARHGHFEIGSWSGLSLLTKSLLLVTPGDVQGLPPPIRAVLPYAERDRALIAAQPDLAARLRAQVQSASSDLRWSVFIPDAGTNWPAWRQADWRRRGQMAGDVSKILIRRHPLGALSLWANDWLSLVVQPAYWPAGMTQVTPEKKAFIGCGQDHNCWALERYGLPPVSRIILLGVSISGPIAALLVIILAGLPVLRRRADAVTILFVAVALVLQASLLLTSAFEAGHVRYTVAMHVLELPLLTWLALLAGRRWLRWLAARRGAAA